MNKTELVAAMAEQTNLSKKDAEAALKAFIDVVTDNLIFTSEEFLNFQGPIAAAYLKDEVDVTDDSQMDAFYEELFAYFGGRIHAGIYDAELCPMFRNYGAVKAAWYELIRKNR